jgi:succinate dehydrogenase/fumarate reductase flavoprotein subunit
MERYIVEAPWELDYERVNIVDTDVLILGGGIAGSWAAISAARQGVKVCVVEQGDILSAGPAGCDHWMFAFDNPCCKISADEAIEWLDDYANGIVHYINFKEGYKSLLDLERMGAKIRDTDDEFKGAQFRDEDTKLLFAYDYDNKHSIRVWGQTFRSALNTTLMKLRVNIYNRIRVTSLLTKIGKIGANVVGATGVNTRTGEFYIFKAKATVLCTGAPDGMRGLWSYTGFRFLPATVMPNYVGAGHAIAWRAGAQLTLMESRGSWAFWGGAPPYTSGNAGNTWYPCTIVDAEGKVIPWVDKDGKKLESFEERVHPSLRGQKLYAGFYFQRELADLPKPLCDTPEFESVVKKGEYVLPLYADLPSMPAHERRAIFGLMVANEGKTWIAYYNLARAGFDPEKDMLQWYGGKVNKLDPSLRFDCSLRWTRGGLVHDWDFKTNLEGLYVAGDIMFGRAYHVGAVVSGRWAGAKAAEYAKKAPEPTIDEWQVDAERERVYAPAKRTEGIDWKELNVGISRIMRVYCGDYINEEMLNIALTWFKELREKEVQQLVARNPHELVRCLETLDVLTIAEIWTLSALARKASSSILEFFRLDYPELDPPEWKKFITLKQKNGEVIIGDLPLRYWLKPPYAPTYKENYERHKPRDAV